MKEKKVHRLPPCPTWDMAANQSWFEDMAAEGLILRRSRFCGIALEFQKTEPQAIRYRLEPLSGKRRRETEPEESRTRLYQELGWNFVCVYAGNCVYRSTDPAAPELNTDPAVQALTLRNLKKQALLAALYFVILGIILFGIIAPCPLLFMLTYGSLLLSLLLVLMGVLTIQGVAALVHIRRLYRQLSAGRPMEHRKHWKKDALRNRANQIILYAAFLLFLLLWGQYLAIDQFGYGRIPLSGWTEDVPFVTLTDLAPEYREYQITQISNGYGRRWSDPLSPVNFEWMDGGSVTYPGGGETAGLLMISYHETISSTLAKALALDYARRDQLYNGSALKELEGLDLDYAVIGQDNAGRPAVVLRHGNTVVYAVFGMRDPQGFFTMDAWTAAMAERLMSQ